MLNTKTYTEEELLAQLQSVEIEITNKMQVIRDDMTFGEKFKEDNVLKRLKQQKLSLEFQLTKINIPEVQN
jgi:hypothetical protein